MQEIHEKLTSGLRDFFEKTSHRKAVLGLSGGLDSAVTLKLAVDALGDENVTAILMPENGVTKGENVLHAKGLCQFLRVEYYYQPINSFMLDYAALPWKQNEIAYANTKARIRATILYNYANTKQALVVGTSNKSELILGYGTKYGDLASDVLPLGELYKTDVQELADFMDLPKEIIEKAPSAELYAGQTDEQELGASYKELDIILRQRDLGEEALIEKGMNAVLVRSIFKRINDNAHKLVSPPIITL
ncbi:NAD(+) synthetase [bacterium]|nr:NAD(+) synthetase [bacterium]